MITGQLLPRSYSGTRGRKPGGFTVTLVCPSQQFPTNLSGGTGTSSSDLELSLFYEEVVSWWSHALTQPRPYVILLSTPWLVLMLLGSEDSRRKHHILLHCLQDPPHSAAEHPSQRQLPLVNQVMLQEANN